MVIDTVTGLHILLNGKWYPNKRNRLSIDGSRPL